MAWYDYVPIASNIHGMISGNPAQMLGGPLGYGLSKPGEDAANKAGNAQMSAMDKAMQRLKAGSAEQYANRMKDLEATMSFYGPAQRYLDSIFGGDPNSTGPRPLASGPPGMGGAPPPPPPGFPKPQGPPTPMSFGQGPRRGF